MIVNVGLSFNVFNRTAKRHAYCLSTSDDTSLHTAFAQFREICNERVAMLDMVVVLNSIDGGNHEM